MKFMTGQQLHASPKSHLVSWVSREKTKPSKSSPNGSLEVTGYSDLQVRVYCPGCGPDGLGVDKRFSNFGNVFEFVDDAVDPSNTTNGYNDDVVNALIASGESFGSGVIDEAAICRDTFVDDDLFLVFEPDDIKAMISRLTELL